MAPDGVAAADDVAADRHVGSRRAKWRDTWTGGPADRRRGAGFAGQPPTPAEPAWIEGRGAGPGRQAPVAAHHPSAAITSSVVVTSATFRMA